MPMGGRPLIATVIACLVALIGGAGSAGWGVTGESFSFKMGYLVGGVAVTTVILWLIAWVLTIRKASPRWWVGSFVSIALASCVAGLAQLGAPVADFERQSAESRAMLEKALSEGEKFRGVAIKSDSGPLVRMGAVILNGSAEDWAAFDAEAKKAGVKDFSLDTVKKGAAVLGRCEQMAEVGRRSLTYYAPRMDKRIQEAERIGRQAEKEGSLPPGATNGFLSGVREKRPSTQRRWELGAEFAESSARLCRILRDRQWSRSDGQFVFTNRADAAAFNREIERANALAAEEKAMVARAKRGAQANLKAMGN